MTVDLTPEHTARHQCADKELHPEVRAAYRYVESVLDFADVPSSKLGGPLWFGWALREAFLAGCSHAARNAPGNQLEPLERPIWTEGVCGDGAAILKDGVMQPIEDVIAALNAAEAVRLKPVGPSLEEVEDLCEEHEFCVEGCESTECLQGLINDAVARYSGSTIAPISLKERLPRPEDCNERGECWHWQQGPESWELISPPENYYVFDEWTHWLPHWALPIPATENIQ